MAELVKRCLVHRFDSLEKIVVSSSVQTTDIFSFSLRWMETDIRVAM